MTEPQRRATLVVAPEPEPKPEKCAGCKALAKERRELRLRIKTMESEHAAAIAALVVETKKLTRAVVRESDYNGTNIRSAHHARSPVSREWEQQKK